MIKHVTFDLWGTLIKSNPGFNEAKVYYLKERYSLPHSANMILDKWDQVGRYFTEKDMATGKHSPLEDRLLALLDALDISPMLAGDIDGVYTCLHRFFLENPPEPFDLNTIEQLKLIVDKIKSKGGTVGMISNTGIIQSQTILEALDILKMHELFDFFVFSDSEGASKPNHVIYNKALKYIRNHEKKTDSHGGEWLHVGDNMYADGVGAWDNGAKSLIINSTHACISCVLTRLK